MAITPKKKRPVTDIDEALDMISTGLLMLEQSNLEKVGGRQGVDITAKMNAQLLTLQALVIPRKEKLKIDNQEDKPTTFVRGLLHRARIIRYPKSFLNLDVVKKFLGPKIDACYETKQVTEISFEVQP